MACVSTNGDVICFTGDAHYKVPFVHPEKPINFPRQARILIQKAIISDGVFAFLAHNGDVFMMNTSEGSKEASKITKQTAFIRPHCVWTGMQECKSAHDIALGVGGSLVVCTKSGHLYVRSKQGKLVGKGAKYTRIPYIQRALGVYANTAGSFAALKQEFCPGSFVSDRQSLEDAFRSLLPKELLNFPESSEMWEISNVLPIDDEDHQESGLSKQASLCARCLRSLAPLTKFSPESVTLHFVHGTARDRDKLTLVCGQLQLVTHMSLLYIRCPSLAPLKHMLSDGLIAISPYSSVLGRLQVNFTGCSPLALLCLILYLYTDDVIPVWDRRLSPLFQSCKHFINAQRVWEELHSLAQLLQLPALEFVVQLTTIRQRQPTLTRDLQRVYETLCRFNSASPLPPDVMCDVKLHFEDRVLYCSSCVLQARSHYFAVFFKDDTWTRHRKSVNGFIEIFLPHMRWCFGKVAFAHIYYGAQEELFEAVGEHFPLSRVFHLSFGRSGLYFGRICRLCF
jgi:inhibitor of Bruton tyrosine kinase